MLFPVNMVETIHQENGFAPRRSPIVMELLELAVKSLAEQGPLVRPAALPGPRHPALKHEDHIVEEGDRLSPLGVGVLSIRDIGIIADHTLLSREQSLGQARRFAGAGRAKYRNVSTRQRF